MSNDERIARLWNQARNFRIVTAGDGNVSGGFDTFPNLSDRGEQLDYLEKAVSKFTLSGQNVQVAGSFDAGYILT